VKKIRLTGVNLRMLTDFLSDAIAAGNSGPPEENRPRPKPHFGQVAHRPGTAGEEYRRPGANHYPGRDVEPKDHQYRVKRDGTPAGEIAGAVVNRPLNRLIIRPIDLI